MYLDFIKTTEVTSVTRQLIDGNKGLFDTLFDTSKDIAKRGVDYQRSVLTCGINALGSARKEVKRLHDEVCAQVSSFEKRARETVESVGDKAVERTDELFDRIGNPSTTFGNAVKDSLLESVDSISQPSVDMLKKVSEQVTEVPSKLLKTAAQADKKPAKKALVARASAPKKAAVEA